MNVFEQIAIVVGLAAGLGVVMDRLRQPALLGYILAGVIAARLGIMHGGTEELLGSLGEVGITLLLFLVGLELSWPKLQAVGRAAVLTGAGQVTFTSVGGLVIGRLLGLDWVTAAYVAIALTFSSTIIVVKLLGQKGDMQSLYGRIAVGMLLVQDFVAILILVFLSGLRTGNLDGWVVAELVVKSIIVLISVILLSRHLVRPVVEKLAHSTELLFVGTVAWGLGMAALIGSEWVGFSIEVGGFIAGITLANSIEQHQILARMRPLRDFFITVFFVVLGSGLVIEGIGEGLWWQVIVFSAFVLIGNPLIVMVMMRFLKYRMRTGFMVSLTVAQISEFSLIVVTMGQKLGHVNEAVVGMVTIVGVVTMTMSTYMILGADKIWVRIGNWLKKWELKNSRDSIIHGDWKWKDHVVLVGCDRTGRAIHKQLSRLGKDVVIVDFNPTVVKELMGLGLPVVYGDAEDVDNLEYVFVETADMLVSTVIDKEATLMMLEYLKTHSHRRGLLVVVTAEHPNEAKLFYEKGADYVMIPRWTSGVYLGQLLAKTLENKNVLLRQAKREREEIG